MCTKLDELHFAKYIFIFLSFSHFHFNAWKWKIIHSENAWRLCVVALMLVLQTVFYKELSILVARL